MNTQDTDVMTVAQVAEVLRLHPLTVRRMVNEGTLPAFKVGRQWRVKRAILEQWMRTWSLDNLA